MADETPLGTWKKQTSKAQETQQLAEKLGRLLRPGDVIALVGGLGSGKTLFCQGLARGLEVPENYYITSPTFVFVHAYPGRIPFYHLDLYRLQDGIELSDLGLEEILYGEGAVAIEWAERLGKDLPAERLEVYLEVPGESLRNLTFKAVGGNWQERLTSLAESGQGENKKVDVRVN